MKPNVLFVSPPVKNCGIYQFGLNVWANLVVGNECSFTYADPKDMQDLIDAVRLRESKAVIYNWYPGTMPCLMDAQTTVLKLRDMGVKQIHLYHEFPCGGFDAYLYSDPTEANHDNHFFFGRPIPSYNGPKTINTIPTIGSAGFGFDNKGYDSLVRRVTEEFDEVIINLHMPNAHYGDRNGAITSRIASECRTMAASSRKRITLNISHQFMERDEYMRHLAANDINCYFYRGGNGISSSVDDAMATGRPIAITSNPMMKHLLKCNPSICIEDLSLKQILANGTAPLAPTLEASKRENILEAIEKCVLSLL